jgi:hypothetical protein
VRAALKQGSPQNLQKTVASLEFTSSLSIPSNLAGVWRTAKRGRRAINKKSGLGNKLVNVIDQDVLQSLWLFGHYLLVLGIRLFKNSKCVTNDWISREEERDSPCNNWSSIGGKDVVKKCHQLMQQTIAFLEGAAVKHFVQYARVWVRNIAKIRSKTAIKGQFAAQLTQFLVAGLSRSLVLEHLHLSKALKTTD